MDKSFVEVYIPILEKVYDVFIPRDLQIGIVLQVIKRLIATLNKDEFTCIEGGLLCNRISGAAYDNNLFVWETEISNGSKLMII